MCVIVCKPIGTTITRKTLKNCFEANPDGAGFMYTTEINGIKELYIQKGFFHFRKFYKTFRVCERANPESNFILHFRIATSGLKDTDNCHPFQINNTTAFVHNGIFTGYGNKWVSDTRMFMYDILRKLPPDFLVRENIREALNTYIKAAWCKLAFLDIHNNYTIINENAGYWNDGIWYSNTSYNGIYTYSDYIGDKYDLYYETYRPCSICHHEYPLAKLGWVGKFNGWVCKNCNTSRYENSHICDICNLTVPISTTRYIDGTVYCATCWEDTLEYHSIICPYCCMNVTVDKFYNCCTCGEHIGLNDYMDMLNNFNSNKVG